MKKRLISFVIVIAAAVFALQFGFTAVVSAEGFNNAVALTPVVYNKGAYSALCVLTVYSSADGVKSIGKSVPAGASVNVTSVSGEYGKITYNGSTGWINLSYAYNTRNTVNISDRLNMLRVKFPDGKYWNKADPEINDPDGYTDTPCADGHSDRLCTYFDGTCQCHGFSLKLAYDLFGIHASCWERHYDINKVKAGDLIRYRNRHTVMVTGVYSTYFTVADCNWLYHCGIEWDRRMEKSFFSFYEDSKNDGVYHCPTNGGYINTNATNSTTSTTAPKTTTTTTRPTASVNAALANGISKYILKTKLSVQGKSTAVLAKSRNEIYTVSGVTKNGETSFTFNAPAGKYPEFVIIVDGCEEYVIKNFTLGKDSLPATVKVNKVANPADETKVNVSSVKITSQPSNASVKSGQNVTFTVKATGKGLKYQWYYKKADQTEWSLWKGRVTSSITATSNDSWHNIQVRCRVTDVNGKSATSSSAKVTLKDEVKITKQPANASVKSGASVKFTVKATGIGLKYQWYYKKSGQKEWQLWKGRVASSFTTTSNDTWHNIQIRCVITGSNGKLATSSVAKVTLTDGIKITKQPAGVSVKSGANVTFTVKATGTGLKYQWYYKKSGAKEWSLWKGHTASSLTATSNNSWNGMAVYCRITDANGKSLKSSEAKVKLLSVSRG